MTKLAVKVNCDPVWHSGILDSISKVFNNTLGKTFLQNSLVDTGGGGSCELKKAF